MLNGRIEMGSRGLTAGVAALICAVLLISGCREKTVIAPPVGVEEKTEDYWVRVLLANNVKNCSVRPESSYSILNSDTNTLIGKYSKSYEPVIISAKAGLLLIGNMPVKGSKITIAADQPFVFYLNDKGYRGEAQIIVNADGTIDVVNRVPMETYLAGVVGAEMPSYWEGQALKAQAIASRTYCLYVKQTSGRYRHYDVSKTQASQVYHGLEAESPRVWQAVNDTTGVVLYSRNDDGDTALMPAYFSALCGGKTESAKKVFGNGWQGLAGGACPYCVKTAKKDMYFWPTVQFDKKFVQAQLVAKYPSLAGLGDIVAIMIAERSELGQCTRMIRVRLIGAGGKGESIRAEDLRLAIDPTGQKIKSTMCQVNDNGKSFIFTQGRGFGHGVGLCQYGALAMAREGKTYRQILDFYYPGSFPKKLY